MWRADVQYDWRAIPDGTGVGYITPPLTADTVVVGPGSVDLWIAVVDGDTDIEATISEVRPDGSEIYVQSGWLRASQRALDEAASTELRPVHTNLESDAGLPLDVGELTPVRIELFPFAHPFRAGSQLRLTVDAPGGNRAVWAFDTTISDGETVTVGHGGDTPSRLVLAVVPGVAVPDPAPAACRRPAGSAVSHLGSLGQRRLTGAAPWRPATTWLRAFAGAIRCERSGVTALPAHRPAHPSRVLSVDPEGGVGGGVVPLRGCGR